MRSLVALGVVLVLAVAGIVGMALLLGSVGGGADADSRDREPLNVVTAAGDIFRLSVEIADTQEERSIGLSNRDELPEDTGMLFVFGGSTTGGFWMKDTFIPLSIAFLDRCGEIIEIRDMQPESLDIVRPEGAYEYGLEVRQGWFADNGVGPGDLVALPRDLRPDGC